MASEKPLGVAFKPYPFTPRLYAARTPPLIAGMDARRHPVVIAGAGPVGLALALGLANQGVASVVLESDSSVCSGSRAICVSRRSLEIIQRLGALKPFLAKGLPWSTGVSFYRDTEVLRLEMSFDKNQKLTPMLNIEQFYIEQYLLDEAETHADLIDIRWATTVKTVRQDGDGVRIDVSTPIGDYALDADWLAACDGARSQVREQLGLALRGESYEGRYVVADIAIKSERPVGRLAWFDPPSNPGSTILVHIQPDDIWRIDYQVADDEDPDEAVKPDNVIPRVASHLAMMGERADWSPVWITIYRAHALSLDRYRHGRVMFAGDAAHLVPIFGVRGLNSGIDDADNLAWKLATVVGGQADEALLDSYCAERVAAARENLRQGMKSTAFMAPPSFAFSLMRTAVLSLAADHPALRSLINPRQSMAIDYTASPLNAPDDGAEPFAAGPAPGFAAPECPVTRVDDGDAPAYLTDLIASCFTVLHFSDDRPPPRIWTELEATLAVPFRLVALHSRRPDATQTSGGAAWDHTGRLFPLYGAEPGCVYLLRPDGHVLGRWRHGDPAVVVAAIRRVLHGKAPR